MKFLMAFILSGSFFNDLICSTTLRGHGQCFHNKLDRGQKATCLKKYIPGRIHIDKLNIVGPEKIKKYTVGSFFICALSDDGLVSCAGRNELGELGNSNKIPHSEINLAQSINFGTTQKVIDIDSGPNHSCALFEDGSVKCWGWNVFNQSQVVPQNLGREQKLQLQVIGDHQLEVGEGFKSIQLKKGLKATQISTGSFHSCALLSDQSVECWGDNRYGQLGKQKNLFLAQDKFTKIVTGETYTCGKTTVGKIKCWGKILNSNAQGMYLKLEDHEVVQDLQAGRFHVCALFHDKLRCWGANLFGESGQQELKSITEGDLLGSLIKFESSSLSSMTVNDWYTCGHLRDGNSQCIGDFFHQ